MNRMPRLSSMAVTIVGTDWETGKIMCRDSFGNEFEIDGRLRRKGTGYPVEGERWLLDRRGNSWVLDMQIGAPAVATIKGTRDGLHPVAVQMLEALARQGLVFDGTIAGVVPIVFDDDNDFSPSTPEDEEWEDAGDEGVPEEDPKDEQPPKEPNDDPKPGSEVHHEVQHHPGHTPHIVKSDLFTITSYNMFHGIGPARAKAELRRLWGQSDILGLQECHHGDRGQVLANAPDVWSLYRPAGGHEPPIMWRNTVFTKLAEGSRTLSTSDGSGSARPARVVNWVRLRHKPTQSVLTVINYHWENAAAFRGYFDRHSRPSAARHVERYKEQMPKMMELFRDMAKYGPILHTGDFNVNIRKDLQLRNHGLPTATFRNIDMRSCWDILGTPPIGTHGGVHGSVFDAVWLKNKTPGQVRLIRAKVLRGYASDHRPVVVRARIRSLKRR